MTKLMRPMDGVNPKYVPNYVKAQLLSEILENFQLQGHKRVTFQQVLEVLYKRYHVETRTIGNFFKDQLKGYKTIGGNRKKFIEIENMTPVEFDARALDFCEKLQKRELPKGIRPIDLLVPIGYRLIHNGYVYGINKLKDDWFVNRWPVGQVQIPPYTEAWDCNLEWRGIIGFEGVHAKFETAEAAAEQIVGSQ